MRHQISNPDFFKQEIAKLPEDLSRDWRCYPCLVWPRGKQKGYGAVAIKGKHYRAHRLAYAMFHELEEDMDVCHHCDNPACYHPAHLFKGTGTDNMTDCVKKGRSRKGRKQLITTGEKNYNAKITDEIARTVKGLHRKGIMQTVIARQLGVSLYIVNKIASGKAWTHVV